MWEVFMWVRVNGLLVLGNVGKGCGWLGALEGVRLFV